MTGLNVRMGSQMKERNQAERQIEQEKAILPQVVLLAGKNSAISGEKGVASCCTDIMKGACYQLRKQRLCIAEQINKKEMNVR